MLKITSDTVKILLKAQEYMQQHGWCQGRYELNGAVCLVGALDPSNRYLNVSPVMSAITELANAIIRLYDPHNPIKLKLDNWEYYDIFLSSSAMYVILFNDSPTTTREMIDTVWHEAIAMAN